MSTTFVKDYVANTSGKGHVQISDISPITHDVEVKLSKSSKNLFNSNNIIKGSFDSVGGFLNGDHLLRTERPINVVSGSTYTVSCDPSYDLRYVYFYSANNEYISNIWMGRPKNHYYTFTVPNGAEFVNIGFEIDGVSTSTNVNLDDAKTNSKMQLELGSTATEYEPYSSGISKNLVPYPYLQIEQNGTLFSDGIDFTDLGDGRIRAVGTATKTVSLVLSHTISLVDSVTYSIKVTDTDKINVVVSYLDTSGTQNWWGQGSKRTWNKDYTVKDVYIQITSGAVIDTIIEPMICEGTDVDTPYERYFPTFEGMKVTTCGKNLIPYPYTSGATHQSNGITYTMLDDGGIRLNGANNGSWQSAYYLFKRKLIRAGTYRFSFKGTNGTIDNIFSYSVNGTTKYDGNTKVTFAEDTYVTLYIQVRATDTTVFDNLVVYPMLELGDTATDYEPYTSAEYTALADGTVPGVKSIANVMHISTEIPSVSIEATYYNQLYDGGVAARLVTIAENVPKVYAAGQKSMVDESKIIEKTISGHGSVYATDVSEIPHEVEVKLSGPAGKNLFDFEQVAQHILTHEGRCSIETFNGKRCLKLVENAYAPIFYLPNDLIRGVQMKVYVDGDTPPSSFFTFTWEGINRYAHYKTSREWGTISYYHGDKGAMKSISIYVQSMTSPVYIDLDSVMFEASTTPTEYEPYTEDFTGKKVTVCGKNLIPYPHIDKGVVTRRGITFTDLGDGRIKAVGTNDGDYAIFNLRTNFNLVDGVTYTLTKASADAHPVMSYLDETGTTRWWGHSSVRTWSKNYRITAFVVQVLPNKTVDTIVAPMLFEGTDANEPYEPYVGGEYTANADGVNAKSVSPNMHVIADADISATYHRSYGMDLHHNRFWDEYQELGTRTNYDGAFCGKGWSNDTIRPKYDICPTQAMWFMRYSSFSGDLVKHLEEMGVSLDFKDCVYFNEAFANASYITRVGVIDLRKCTSEWNTTDMFTNANSLVTIDKVIVDEGTAINYGAFRHLPALENITFDGVIVSNDLRFGDSTKLTHSSLMSIINALQDKTGDTSGKSWVVTIGSTNKAKLTADELKIATDKGWTIN